MPLLYTIGQYTVAPAVRLAFRPTVEGLENVPAKGGAVLAGNHLSVADEYIMGAVVPRHIAFWAKAEYFNGTGLGGFAMKTLMRGLGAIDSAFAGHDRVVLVKEELDEDELDAVALPAEIPLYAWDTGHLRSHYRGHPRMPLDVSPAEPARMVFRGLDDSAFSVIPLIEAVRAGHRPWLEASTMD